MMSNGRSMAEPLQDKGEHLSATDNLGGIEVLMDKLIENIIRGVFGILHIPCGDGLIGSLVQFVKFGIVGVSNTLLSYGINVAMLLILSPLGWSFDYVIANLTAFFLSVLWSFYWNNKYVFTVKGGQKRNTVKALVKTYISYSFTGIFLTNIMAYVWINILGISKFIAPLITLVFSVPINFLINKFWAFKQE